MKEVPFEDRFGLLVDVEYTSRKNNRLKRLIHNAELEQSDACIAGIDYTSGRRLNKDLINVWHPVNTSLSTETSLLPVQPAVVKHIWHVPLEWKPASNTLQLNMSGFRIYC